MHEKVRDGCRGSEKTNLVDLHPHALTLGMLIFLILSVFGYFSHSFAADRALFVWFMIIYNIEVLGTLFMLMVRGLIQAKGKEISKKKDVSVSDTSGLFYIVLFAGLILLFCTLFNCM